MDFLLYFGGCNLDFEYFIPVFANKFSKIVWSSPITHLIEFIDRAKLLCPGNTRAYVSGQVW